MNQSVMFEKIAMHKFLIMLLIVMPLSGCTTMKAVFAMTKSTDQFIELKDQPAIKYEKGSEKFAVKISLHLEEAVQVIESKQYGTFPNKVTVYVPSSIESFSSYCASPKPSACVIGN